MSESPASRIYPIAAFSLIALGIGSLTVKVLAPFGPALAWAIVLAVGFAGPWRFVERKMPRRRSLAAVLLTLAIGLLVILPAAFLVGVLVNEAIGVVGGASAALAAKHVSGPDDLFRIPAVRDALAWVEARSGVTPAELLVKAGEIAQGLYGVLARFSGGVVKGLFEAALTFLVTLFILFFLLRDGREMVRALLDLVPLEEERRVALLGSLRGMLQSIFRGSLLTALIQGAAGGIGWLIAGLPSPFLAGAAMAVLSLLPIGGTAIVWAPGAIACWLQGRPGMAAFLAIWGIVIVSMADNVLKPLLISGSSELSTLVVFLGVFGGLGAFGVLGLFIGPMVLAVGLTLLRILRETVRHGSLSEGGRAAS
ncbi:MAG TPA: AI-2E family transporter [Thermoanaerobaculia bacterium]|nr:AI-2E family transporter [Thermoanaerobaculia bacterium]